MLAHTANPTRLAARRQPARDIAAAHGVPVASLVAAAAGARTPADPEVVATALAAATRTGETP